MAGRLVLVLAGVFVAEIVLTLTDFVVEIAVRKQLGDVYAGERVTHAVMGILYNVAWRTRNVNDAPELFRFRLTLEWRQRGRTNGRLDTPANLTSRVA